jgi:hypothetical protein
VQVFVLFEFLREVLLIESGIARTRQHHDPHAHFWCQQVPWLTPTITVHQRSRSITLVARLEPFERALRQTEQSTGFGHAYRSSEDLIQDIRATLLDWVQAKRLPFQGVTKSLPVDTVPSGTVDGGRKTVETGDTCLAGRRGTGWVIDPPAGSG